MVSAEQQDGRSYFYPEGHQHAGCVRHVDELHAEYISGKLSDENCILVERHLLACIRCENGWVARSEMVDTELWNKILAPLRRAGIFLADGGCLREPLLTFQAGHLGRLTLEERDEIVEHCQQCEKCGDALRNFASSRNT